MTPPVSPRVGPSSSPRHFWVMVVVGLSSFHGLAIGADAAAGLWLPALGLGIALVSWLGFRIVPLLAVDLAIVTYFGPADRHILDSIAISLLLALEIAAAWWIYHHVAGGSRWLEDPRSAVLFLLLVPGLVSATSAAAQLALFSSSFPAGASYESRFGALWISRVLGILVVTPVLLVVVTPILQYVRWIDDEKIKPFSVRDWNWGDAIELVGLTFGNSVLAAIQASMHLQSLLGGWNLGGIGLLFVIWSSVRQGLQGGTVTSFAGSAMALLLAQIAGADPAQFSPLQGHFLAQCTSALLVGSSVGWIRTTEARYRQIVGHLPLVLVSVRMGRNAILPPPKQPDRNVDLKSLPNAVQDAEVLLVSRACTSLFGVAPERLIGPYSQWLDHVHPEDRPVVIASVNQMGRQRQPVVCEYRIISASQTDPPARTRWVRETFAPHYSLDDTFDGWEGVIEEITEQRALQQENRRITSMLQGLVANLPMGVFFVSGPNGQPLLVNARARQLLGQREDHAAGLVHLSRVYRLFRHDGTEYPNEELPVYRALKQGQTCTANDIIVHRPDGRRVPLFTWAAPVDLGQSGRADSTGAVWVLEDLTSLQKAEHARREVEARLRAMFEAMAEGVVVQDKTGVILEANPAAATILGVSLDKLVGRNWLGGDASCLRDDSLPCPVDQHPDRVAMQIKLPVRNVVLGYPREPGDIRWLLVSSMPLPVGQAFAPNSRGAQLVTTFADITQQREAQQAILSAKERYQSLIETLPVMVLQLACDGSADYLNPAAQRATGYAAADLAQPGFLQSLIDPADRPRFSITLQQSLLGKAARFEFGYTTKDGQAKMGYALVHPRTRDQRIVGSTWLIVDMTRQRHLEDELVRSQRLELIGRLASGAVHEINSHFLGIVAASAACKRESQDLPVALGQLAIIEESAHHGMRLLSQILSLGKPSMGQAEALLLNPVVSESLLLVRPMLPHSVHLEARLVEHDLVVHANSLHIQQIVLNLCLNACDVMVAGGTLRVVTEHDSDPTGSWAILRVEDTRSGIDPTIRDRLVDPFAATQGTGGGLGLSVVHEVVQQLGGTIDVQSKPGQGTRFEIRLRQHR